MQRNGYAFELEKTLLSDSPQVISEIIGYGLLHGIVVKDSPLADLTVLKRLQKNRTLRWAGLCALLLKSDIIDNTEKFLTSLRLDSATIQSCSKGCSLVSGGARLKTRFLGKSFSL